LVAVVLAAVTVAVPELVLIDPSPSVPSGRRRWPRGGQDHLVAAMNTDVRYDLAVHGDWPLGSMLIAPEALVRAMPSEW